MSPSNTLTSKIVNDEQEWFSEKPTLTGLDMMSTWLKMDGYCYNRSGLFLASILDQAQSHYGLPKLISGNNIEHMTQNLFNVPEANAASMLFNAVVTASEQLGDTVRSLGRDSLEESPSAPPMSLAYKLGQVDNLTALLSMAEEKGLVNGKFLHSAGRSHEAARSAGRDKVMDNWLSTADGSKGLKLYEKLMLVDLAHTRSMTATAPALPDSEVGNTSVLNLTDLESQCSAIDMAARHPEYAGSTTEGTWGVSHITSQACAGKFADKVGLTEAKRPFKKWTLGSSK